MTKRRPLPDPAASNTKCIELHSSRTRISHYVQPLESTSIVTEPISAQVGPLASLGGVLYCSAINKRGKMSQGNWFSTRMFPRNQRRFPDDLCKYARIQRHSKLFASSVLPSPLYWACVGYGQSGRLRPGNGLPVATTEGGAVPISTQSTMAPRRSN
jgi:hypothetical protein